MVPLQSLKLLSPCILFVAGLTRQVGIILTVDLDLVFDTGLARWQCVQEDRNQEDGTARENRWSETKHKHIDTIVPRANEGGQGSGQLLHQRSKNMDEWTFTFRSTFTSEIQPAQIVNIPTQVRFHSTT